MSLHYDSEWLAMAGESLQGQKEVLPVGDVVTRRNRYAALFVGSKYQLPEDIELEVHKTAASDGYQVEILHLALKASACGLAERSPAVLHVHGGGFISVHARDVLGSLVAYVRETGVPFFSVDYRWAPENPFPIPVEDCWTGLQYLHSQAETLGVDPSRIAVMGESAGGGLAAGVALIARHRQLSPPLAKQILLYPMLDDRTVTDHSKGLAVFSINDVYTGWGAYLGDAYNTENVSAFAAPARVADVSGLPQLYLDVGQLDIFLHEDLEYANKFLCAGIQTEFHVYPGVIHAFQRWSAGSHVVRQAFVNRIRAMSTL